MRPPRYHLRTLIIAVAVVGVELAFLVSFSGPIVMILPCGPLVGIACALFRLREQRYAYFRGGLWGGLVQAVPLTPDPIANTSRSSTNTPKVTRSWVVTLPPIIPLFCRNPIPARPIRWIRRLRSVCADYLVDQS
jgi:hypothetical protein